MAYELKDVSECWTVHTSLRMEEGMLWGLVLTSVSDSGVGILGKDKQADSLSATHIQVVGFGTTL